MTGHDARMTLDRRALVEHARGGDHDAFAILAREASRRLHGAAYVILRDHELAEDGVQEALIRAWRDLPGLRDPEKFEAWLHRLLVNSCVDLIRRRRRRVAEVRLEGSDAPSRTDISQDLATRDLLDAALLGLDPRSRALVVGHLMLGMPLPDVASALHIPLGTAKSGLHRALASMRLRVDDDRERAEDIAGEPE